MQINTVYPHIPSTVYTNTHNEHSKFLSSHTNAHRPTLHDVENTHLRCSENNNGT